MEFDLFAEVPATSETAPTMRQLHLKCPLEFKNPNSPWRIFAEKIYRSGANGTNWRFKDERRREQQMSCLLAVCVGARLDGNHESVAVAAWILSEMLEIVPEFVPRSGI